MTGGKVQECRCGERWYGPASYIRRLFERLGVAVVTSWIEMVREEKEV